MNHLFSFGLSAVAPSVVVTSEAMQPIHDFFLSCVGNILPIGIIIFCVLRGIHLIREAILDYAIREADFD